MKLKQGEEEPMMNLLAWTVARKNLPHPEGHPLAEGDVKYTCEGTTHWVVCIFPRQKHRPTCYTADGDANILISPASVDMGGVFITPREKDFEKLDAKDIAVILSEVCLSQDEFQKLRQRIKEQL